MSTEVFVREAGLALQGTADSKRLEVLADGFPLFGGVHLVID